MTSKAPLLDRSFIPRMAEALNDYPGKQGVDPPFFREMLVAWGGRRGEVGREESGRSVIYHFGHHSANHAHPSLDSPCFRSDGPCDQVRQFGLRAKLQLGGCNNRDGRHVLCFKLVNVSRQS